MGLSLETIVLWVVPVVFAITLHEAAHGYVARHFGDHTAEALGRITLNPLRHIDPIGTVVVPAMLYLTAGPQFVFGWAKPVPVNFGNLRHPKRDMLWVAGAGPFANFVMAFAWMLALKLALGDGAAASEGLARMAQIGVSVNLVLMALNLLPIPPLDGGRIAVSLLPSRAAMAWARLEPFGFIIIVALMFTPLLGDLIRPIRDAGAFLLRALVGI
jgi:Zn-dependent protease